MIVHSASDEQQAKVIERKKMILTVTLNASIDKAYFVNAEPTLGEVNRVEKVRNSAGGKGLNVARAIAGCGGSPIATGFVGGFNGEYLRHLLDIDGVPHDFVTVAGETRSCINVLDGQSSTEFLEPGAEISEVELKQFTNKFSEILSLGAAEKKFSKASADEQIEAVTISGSLPTGVPDDFYSKIIAIASQHGVASYLDTSGAALAATIAKCVANDMPASISVSGSKSASKQANTKPHFIKPNKVEAEQLCGMPIHTVQDAVVAAKSLTAIGIDIVAITLGGDGAVVVSNDEAFYSKIKDDEKSPASKNSRIKNTDGCGEASGCDNKADCDHLLDMTIKNTVGCGDTFVGAFAVAETAGKSLKEATEFALAASKSNAMSDKTGFCDLAQIKNLLEFAKTKAI